MGDCGLLIDEEGLQLLSRKIEPEKKRLGHDDRSRFEDLERLLEREYCTYLPFACSYFAILFRQPSGLLHQIPIDGHPEVLPTRALHVRMLQVDKK